MAKAKISVAALLLVLFCVSLDAQEDVRTYGWKKVVMDNSRSITDAAKKGTAAKTARVIAKVQPQMAHLKEVVGYSPEELVKYGPQSPLSNWVTDFMLVQGSKLSGESCDLSITNFGGIRVDMPKGDVTVDDIRSMFPFKNNLVIVELTGARLMEVMDSMVVDRKLQAFSGMKLVVGANGIESLTVGGQELDMNRHYKLATNSFLLYGGDGINLGYNAVSVKDLGVDIYDSVMDYLKDLRTAGKFITAKEDDRIYVKGLATSGGAAQVGPRPKVGPKSFDGEKRRLTIVHTNDTHSHLDPLRSGEYAGLCGAVERACYVDSLRKADGKDRVLLVDAGDFEQGTPYFTLFGGKVEIGSLNAMRYDAVTLGNHEFDNGTDDLARRLKWFKCPVVVSNYRIDHPQLSKLIKPYTIVKRGGLKIGILGMVTDLGPMVDKNNNKGMTYLLPQEPLNKLADMLKNQEKCDLVIVLSHCGYSEKSEADPGDVQVAAQLRNVDIIIGGHSHTNLDVPTYVNGADGRPVMIVQDYCWGIYAGNIIL